MIGLADVPILAWRRGDDATATSDGPADVTLTRPGDDDLVRTVALLSGVTAPAPGLPPS